jgi:hypothetical protein
LRPSSTAISNQQEAAINQSFEFLDARAKEAAADAQEAKLDQVRERALRSEAAWRQMAVRAQAMEKERAKVAEARAELKDAELSEDRSWT